MSSALSAPDLVREIPFDQFQSSPINQRFTSLSNYSFPRGAILSDDRSDSPGGNVSIYLGNYRRGMGNYHNGLGIMMVDGNQVTASVFNLFSADIPDVNVNNDSDFESTDVAFASGDDLFVNPIVDLDAEWTDIDGDSDLDLMVAYLTHGDQGPDRMGLLFFLNCNGKFKRLSNGFNLDTAGTLTNARCYAGLCYLDPSVAEYPQFRNLNLSSYAPETSWGDGSLKHYRVSYDAFQPNPTDTDIFVGHHGTSWGQDDGGHVQRDSIHYEGPDPMELAAIYTAYMESKTQEDSGLDPMAELGN